MNLNEILKRTGQSGFDFTMAQRVRIAVTRDNMTITLELEKAEATTKLSVFSRQGPAGFVPHFPEELLNRDVVELLEILERSGHQVSVTGGPIELHDYDCQGSVAAGELSFVNTRGQHSLGATAINPDLASLLEGLGVETERLVLGSCTRR